MEMPDSPIRRPKRVLSFVPRIHWPGYSGRYQRLHGSENQKPGRVRRRPAIRLGRRKRVFFVRLCQRLRFRAFSKYSLGFLYKRLKSFYDMVIEELKEAGPGLEAINTSALINAHFSIASLPSSVSSMASMAF
ncbi:hypothetical protein SUGI_0195670 [Cryptomeria japonica]|uniref:uncharacterized protein LOC131061530 n=1 Tax=Cryptomeria japonica TaxID=3369 RepID=UPI002408BE2A|nr:uncharacterized protein LOC131061530 [Cryptomeria japonica]GLJ12677.1 hypothetical protein SUGI_0195670 [Cryptomeria japonica]